MKLKIFVMEQTQVWQTNHCFPSKNDFIFKLIFGDHTELFDWLSFLKSEREEELEMLAEKNASIKKAVGILKELSEDERTRMICGAREQGLAESMAKGRAEGILEFTMKALETGVPADSITGLPRENIDKLR
jgi:hypothetical protein